MIKPLGEVFRNVPGISGGSILGSGEIALIFDIPKLMEHELRKNCKRGGKDVQSRYREITIFYDR